MKKKSEGVSDSDGAKTEKSSDHAIGPELCQLLDSKKPTRTSKKEKTKKKRGQKDEWTQKVRRPGGPRKEEKSEEERRKEQEERRSRQEDRSEKRGQDQKRGGKTQKAKKSDRKLQPKPTHQHRDHSSKQLGALHQNYQKMIQSYKKTNHPSWKELFKMFLHVCKTLHHIHVVWKRFALLLIKELKFCEEDQKHHGGVEQKNCGGKGGNKKKKEKKKRKKEKKQTTKKVCRFKGCITSEKSVASETSSSSSPSFSYSSSSSSLALDTLYDKPPTS